MNEAQYKIVGFKMIPVDELEVPIDNHIPIELNACAMLEGSLKDDGLYCPLLVSATPNASGRHMVIDGVNRYKLLKNVHNAREIPCNLVECDDPNRVILSCLAMGRERSTGQRVMAFLHLHKAEVLAAIETMGGRMSNLRNVSEKANDSSKVSRETFEEFAAVNIAAEHGWSKEDVLNGIDLLVALETGTIQRKNPKVKDGKMDFQFSAETADKIREIHANVLAGICPIRRWRSAVGGAVETEAGDNPEKKRTDPKYQRLAGAAITTVTNAFKSWATIKWSEKDGTQKREFAIKKATEMFSVLPDDLKPANSLAIAKTWKEHEQKELIKLIREEQERKKDEAEGGKKKVRK